MTDVDYIWAYFIAAFFAITTRRKGIHKIQSPISAGRSWIRRSVITEVLKAELQGATEPEFEEKVRKCARDSGYENDHRVFE